MVAFRTIDENGDITFGKGLNNYSRDNKAVRLDIKTSINSWLGDCFFAKTEGIDWWNRLGSKNQQELLEQDIKSAILKVEEVTAITAITVEVTNRKFSASYTVNTIFSKGFADLVEGTL
tara:strand:- start:2507 stop:2863 length:357 start_codon:yes stop_codon:yes gene_type:complete